MRQNSYTAGRYQRPAPAHHQLPRRRATGESHRKQISDAPDAQSSGIPPPCDGTVTPQTDSETTGAKTVSSPLPCDRIITRRAGSTVIRTQPSHTSPRCDLAVTRRRDTDTIQPNRSEPARRATAKSHHRQIARRQGQTRRYLTAVQPTSRTAGRFTTTPAVNHPPIIHMSPTVRLPSTRHHTRAYPG